MAAARYSMLNIQAQKIADEATKRDPAVTLNARLRKVQTDIEEFPNRAGGANDVYGGLRHLFAELTECCASKVNLFKRLESPGKEPHPAEIFMPSASTEEQDEVALHSRNFIAAVLGEKDGGISRWGSIFFFACA